MTTSIFIASTNRGLVRPYTYTKFQVKLLELTKDVFTEGKREAVTQAVKSALNGQTKKEVASVG